LKLITINMLPDVSILPFVTIWLTHICESRLVL